jgi:hypothetical protein
MRSAETRAEAEDAVQDAFVAALRKQRELRLVANPEAWVRTAALNRLRNTWRHASVVRLYQPKLPGPQAPVEPSPMQDGSRGSFGPCSQDDPTSPHPPVAELDPGRRYEPPEGYALRMFVTGPLSEDAQRCLETTHAFVCPATHGIEPLDETDAVFGFGDFEPRRTRTVMTLDGMGRYEALAIADGAEYLVDRAVIAADGADQLVVRLPASDDRRIVGIAQGETAVVARCIERLGHAPPAGPQEEIEQMEEAERECSTDLRLRVDDAKPSPVEGYFSFVSDHSLVPAGDEHVVTVDVIEGDPRNVRCALVVWEERS